MKILEYLQKKYRNNIPTTMTYQEASAFGIPYPLQKGWLAKHGKGEITEYMQEKLKAKLEAKIVKSKKTGKKTKYHEVAVGLLNNNAKVPPKAYRSVDPTSAEFLTSFAWRSLRMQALKRYGATCACCGDSPKNGAVMNVDHIKPRKSHPLLALDIENLQVLCAACNHGKGNWDETDWRPSTDSQYDPLDGLDDMLRSFMGAA